MKLVWAVVGFAAVGHVILEAQVSGLPRAVMVCLLGCSDPTLRLAGIDLAIEHDPRVVIEQVEIAVYDGARAVIEPTARPVPPRGALAAMELVRLEVRGIPSDVAARVQVRGLEGGEERLRGSQEVLLRVGEVTSLLVRLEPSPAGPDGGGDGSTGLDAGDGAADATPDATPDAAPDALPCQACYPDADEDGYAATSSVVICGESTCPKTYSSTPGTDCDDGCSGCFPGSAIVTSSPDGHDQDCDGEVDENDGVPDKTCTNSGFFRVRKSAVESACAAYCDGGSATCSDEGTSADQYLEFNFFTCGPTDFDLLATYTYCVIWTDYSTTCNCPPLYR